jgi:hypothetical protein
MFWSFPLLGPLEVNVRILSFGYGGLHSSFHVIVKKGSY